MARAPIDLSVYLVTDTVLCGEFGAAATARAAAAAGATAVQLRDPHASDDEMVALGRAVIAALEGSGVPVLVNDRVHLVHAIGAQGAHIGQSDLGVDEARAILGEDSYLGLSVQTVDHVHAARHHGESIDYLGIGPIWSQGTKPDAAAPSGIDTLERVLSVSPWPCVAIGGIDARRTATVRATGAAGVAVVSAICGQPDVAAATGSIRAAWDGVRV
ncbi:thiamine phosphate synthase [Demequina lutea]|uniref:Thiamine-phosphate synthase n=1 Tax=Demequina lutea TaxID=431489 RepID=A0A7Y9ZBA7_9MICO|nr:thiamine phosphate synthase [Demequina lutea]NYI42222.1 thiamine-phosphate pyrophosphorylase [Demequina lutea]